MFLLISYKYYPFLINPYWTALVAGREYCHRSVSTLETQYTFNVPVCRHLGQDAGILPPLSLETQSL